jgi:ribose transport system permease protein
VAGVLIGAMIMGVVRNGLVLMQVSTYWQKLVIGSIIVLAAVIDVVRRRRSAR